MTDASPEPGFQRAEDELSPGTESVQRVVAAEGSALSSLRQRRKEVKSRLFFDLEVPRYDPPIYVRYKPVSQQKIEDTYKRTDKLRGENRTVTTNAIILAEACVGVFEIIDGERVSVDPEDRGGEWPKFEKRLGELLTDIEDGERPPTKGSEVVRKLFFTDGDIIATAQDLATKSGYAQEQLELEPEGN